MFCFINLSTKISDLICVCVQCKQYRSQFTEEKKVVYEEKLEASELFKDKKALYPSRYLKWPQQRHRLLTLGRLKRRLTQHFCPSVSA